MAHEETGPGKGKFTGDLNAYVDPSSKEPRTVRTEPVQQALRTDAKEALKRGRHRAQG